MAILSFVTWPCAEQHRHSLKYRPSYSIEFPTLLKEKKEFVFRSFDFKINKSKFRCSEALIKPQKQKLYIYFGRTQINWSTNWMKRFTEYVNLYEKVHNCEYCHPSNRFIGLHWRRSNFWQTTKDQQFCDISSNGKPFQFRVKSAEIKYSKKYREEQSEAKCCLHRRIQQQDFCYKQCCMWLT